MGDAGTVAGALHVLFVDVIGREVAGDAGKQVGRRSRQRSC